MVQYVPHETDHKYISLMMKQEKNYGFFSNFRANSTLYAKASTFSSTSNCPTYMGLSFLSQISLHFSSAIPLEKHDHPIEIPIIVPPIVIIGFFDFVLFSIFLVLVNFSIVT